MASTLNQDDIKLIVSSVVQAMRQTGSLGGARNNSSGSYSSSNKDLEEARKSAINSLKNLDDLGDGAQDLTDALQNLVNSSRYSTKILDSGSKESEDYLDTLARANRSIFMSADVTDRLFNTLGNFSKETIRKSSGVLTSGLQRVEDLSSSVARAVRSSSMFNASLIKSHESISDGSDAYFKMMNGLEKSARPLNVGMLRAAGVWNDTTHSLKNDLDPTSFAHLRLAIGQVQTTLVEQLSNLGLNKMDDVVKMANGNLQDMFNGEASKELKTGLIGLASRLEASGLELNLTNSKNEVVPLVNKDSSGKTTGLNDEGIKEINADPQIMEQLVLVLQKLEKENTQAMTDFDREAKNSSHQLHNFLTELGVGLPLLGLWKNGLIGTIEEIGALDFMFKGFKMMGTAFKSIYDQVEMFNIAQIPQSFNSVKAQAINMGMSFEDTVKFMEENKRSVALYGSGFGNYMNRLKGTFASFGYNMKQAAAIVGPATALAAASGVNVRNSDAMNSFVAQSMNSFKNISGIVDVSAEEYMKSTATMLSSSEIQGNILGLGANAGKAFAAQLVDSRNKFVQLGLSLDQANDLIKAQNASGRDSAQTKVTDAARLMVRARQAGMSGEDAMKLYRYRMAGKLDGNQSKDYNDLFKSLGAKEEAGRAKSYGPDGGVKDPTAGLLYDARLGALSTSVDGTLLAAGKQEGMADLNKTAVTPKEAKDAGDAAIGTKAIADAGNTINSVSQFLNNNFLKAIEGAAVGLLGLGVQAFITIGALRRLGGGSVLDGFKSLFKGKGGAAVAAGEEAAEIAGKSGILAKLLPVLKGLGGGVVGAIGGMALEAGGDALKEHGHHVSGGLASVAGSALTWAGTGAMIGSVVPGVGTAIGGAIGGLAGGIIGLTSNWNEIFGKAKEQAGRPMDFIDQIEAMGAKTAGAIWKGLMDAHKNMVKGIGGVVGSIISSIGGLGNILGIVFGSILSSISGVVRGFALLGEGIFSIVRKIAGFLPGNIGKMLLGAIPAAGSLVGAADAMSKMATDMAHPKEQKKPASTAPKNQKADGLKTAPAVAQAPAIKAGQSDKSSDQEELNNTDTGTSTKALPVPTPPENAGSPADKNLEELVQYMATAVKLLEIIAEHGGGAKEVLDLIKSNALTTGDSLRTRVTAAKIAPANSFITGKQ